MKKDESGYREKLSIVNKDYFYTYEGYRVVFDGYHRGHRFVVGTINNVPLIILDLRGYDWEEYDKLHEIHKYAYEDDDFIAFVCDKVSPSDRPLTDKDVVMQDTLKFTFELIDKIVD